MKKTFILCLLCCLISCKKSSSPAPTSIVGQWYETKIVLEQFTNGINPVSETTNISDKSTYIVFNSNGTGTSVQSGNSTNFTYSISGSSLTLTPNDDKAVFTVEALTKGSFTLHEVYYYQQGSDIIKDVIDNYFNK